MSSHRETADAPDESAIPTPDHDWAAHRDALRTPELRSALEELHTVLSGFLKAQAEPA